MENLVPKKKNAPIIETAANTLFGFLADTTNGANLPNAIFLFEKVLSLRPDTSIALISHLGNTCKATLPKKRLKFNGSMLSDILTHPKPGVSSPIWVSVVRPSTSGVTLQVPISSLKCFEALLQAILVLKESTDKPAEGEGEVEESPLVGSYFSVLVAESAVAKMAALFQRIVSAAAYKPPEPNEDAPVEGAVQPSCDLEVAVLIDALCFAAAKGSSAPPAELVDAAPVVKLQLLKLIQTLCDRNPAKLDVLATDLATAKALVQCLGDEAEIRNRSLALLYCICNQCLRGPACVLVGSDHQAVPVLVRTSKRKRSAPGHQLFTRLS